MVLIEWFNGCVSISSLAPELVNQYIVYTNLGTGKDSKGRWLTTHWDTYDSIFGDVTMSSLYNITTGIYEQKQSWYLSDITCSVI